MVNTRTPASRHVAKHGAYVRKVSDAVEWYTRDWVARKRRCPDGGCEWSGATVELLLEDLDEGWSRSE